MTISENASVFFNCPVVDFQGPDDYEIEASSEPDEEPRSNPRRPEEIAYRLRTTYDSEKGALIEALDILVAQEVAPQLKALVIGMWSYDDSSGNSEEIIKELIKRRDRLTGLRAIFLGDITYEENEISWIENSDVSPLLQAFPNLEHFRVRGGNSLQFTAIKHDGLRELIVEAGGLHRSVIREICRCDFPNLEHLELWLGSANYGWDGGVEDLQPILDGSRFPKLTYLGLRNSEIVDEIAPVVVNAPVLQKLKLLDLSNGNMTDVGGQALLNLPGGLPLQELNLSHHYMTPDLVSQLQKKLKCKVVADDAKQPDGDWRSILVSE